MEEVREQTAKTLSDYTPEEIESARRSVMQRKQYSQEHKGEKKGYNAQYNQEHRGEIKERNQEHKEERKEYNRVNSEKIRVHSAQYYQEHQEEIKERNTRYNREHPQVQRNTDAKRRGAEGSYTLEEWTLKLEEHDNKCAYCNVKAEDTLENYLTVDHLTPLSRGGTNYISNIAPSCLQCNLEKNTMTAEEFLNSIDAGNEEGVVTRRYLNTHPEKTRKNDN